MASVTRRDTSAGPRYDVRWRLVDGTHRKRSFKRRAEAERYRRKIEGDEVAGVVIDPNSGEIRFGPYAEQWIRTRLVKGQPLSPSTVQVYRGLLRRHLARFSDAPLRKLTPEVVRDWHSDLVESAGRDQAAKSYRLLRAVLNTAVEDLRIGRNPCQIRGAGIERAAERPIVEAATILHLAAAINPRLRALIVLSGFGGLRTGELLALTRRDVDLVHKTVQIRASAAEINGSGRVLGPPKSEAGVRVIALPSLAVKALDDHLSTYVAPVRDAVLFTGPKGGPISRGELSSAWRDAVAMVPSAPTGLHIHDLRHAAATMMARMPGVTTKELMARIGHASPRAALIYQHATTERDRLIADYLDAHIAAAEAAADEVRRAPIKPLRSAPDSS